MTLNHTAYIINHRTYIYIMEFEDTFDYTFYNDQYLVMQTGAMPRAGHTLDQAVDLICSDHHLNPHSVYKLSDEELQEMIDHVDDYNHVNIL